MTDVSVTCCDGPCCGPALASELASLAGTVRYETATCLSECEKAPVLRVRFDDGTGRRVTALLSGSEGADLSGELQAWVSRGGRPPLPAVLQEAEFLPGEGGGCLCDEELPSET